MLRVAWNGPHVGRLVGRWPSIGRTPESLTPSGPFGTILARCRGNSSTSSGMGAAGFPRSGLGIPAEGVAAEGASYIPPSAGGVGGMHQRSTPGRRAAGRFFRVFLPISGIAMWTYAFMHPDKDPLVGERYPPELQYLAAQQTPNTDTLTNWSGTHEATPRRYFQPQSEEEVEAFLRMASGRHETLRPAGSGLSPNGLGLSGEGVLAMGAMDRILGVDKSRMRVTVQAGCRVQQVVEALAPHGLALQNYASIREQQIGGITQVGAHGTGPRIPPVDEQVVAMRLTTPGLGSLALSDTEEPELFRLARVGLGSLGVMTQATLSVVPRVPLIERTFTASGAEVRRNHVRWLQQNKHIKYLYIPYTDTVVVVQVNPPTSPEELREARELAGSPAHSEEDRTRELRRLYSSIIPATPTVPATTNGDPTPSSDPGVGLTDPRVGLTDRGVGLTAPQLRDALLAEAPLDPKWVAAVNGAEADYWRRSGGVRVGFADELLAFDCGGQQWVLEVAFPVAPNLDGLKPGARTRDLEFLDALMAEIKKSRVAAPAPIEVRWSSGSSSPLSPAAGAPESLHCWVGVIMYLPEEPEAREKVTKAFREYCRLVETKLMPRFNATWHWAKLEAIPPARSPEELETLVRPRLAARFGSALTALGRYRAVLDPHGTLSNKWLDAVLGPAPKQQQEQQQQPTQAPGKQ